MKWPGKLALAATVLTCAAGARAEHEAARRLAKRIDVSFVETPLERAVQEVGRLAKVAVVVDVDEIDALERTVRMSLKDVPARVAFDAVLKGTYLTAMPDGYAVRIISSEQAGFERIALRSFDTRDLTYAVTNFPGPEFNYYHPRGACGSADMRLLQDDPPEQCVCSESLAEFVMSRIHPEEWDAALGTSIEERDGRLVVMQRPEVLEKIAGLIRTVRESMETAVRVESAAFLVSASALDAAVEKTRTPGFVGPDERRGFESDLIVAGARRLGRVRVTCFSSQRVYAYAGRVAGMVRDLEVSKGELRPVVGHTFEGYCLDIRPVASHDGRFVTFSASVQATEAVAPPATHTVVAEARAEVDTGGPRSESIRVRLPDLAKHEARVFLQVPSGHAALHCVPAAHPCDEGKSVVFVLRMVAVRSRAEPMAL